MRPLTPTSSAAMLRLCPRRMPLRPSVLATSLSSQHQQQQQQQKQQQTWSKASAAGADYDHQTPAFTSPFKSASDRNETTKIPSFANYMSKRGETSNKTFQYFMVGGMGLLTAAGAKATVQGMFSWAWWGKRLVAPTYQRGEDEFGRNGWNWVWGGKVE